ARRDGARFPDAPPLAQASAGRRGHHDLDLPFRPRQARLDGGARGRLSRRHPGIPGAVHAGEIADVGQVDLRAQDPGLVAARLRQQRVDRLQHFAGLRFDVRAVGFGHLPGEIDHAVVDAGFGHAGAGVDALDHGRSIGKEGRRHDMPAAAAREARMRSDARRRTVTGLNACSRYAAASRSNGISARSMRRSHAPGAKIGAPPTRSEQMATYRDPGDTGRGRRGVRPEDDRRPTGDDDCTRPPADRYGHGDGGYDRDAYRQGGYGEVGPDHGGLDRDAPRGARGSARESDSIGREFAPRRAYRDRGHGEGVHGDERVSTGVFGGGADQDTRSGGQYQGESGRGAQGGYGGDFSGGGYVGRGTGARP